MTKKKVPADINQLTKFIMQETVKDPAPEVEQPTPEEKNLPVVALGRRTHGKDVHIFN
ncbi:MAG: hypothetical protein ABSE95_00050 [Thermodesulfobacteriota bacterium]|jgi:hypothetical protein